MDSKIIEFLKKEGYPCSALQISKGVGKMTAEDVNPTLHRLWNEGCIQRMATEGQEALWFLIKGSSSHDNHTYDTPITAYSCL